MARIIVVEDDLDQQEELIAFLLLSGHKVLGAGSGHLLEQALMEFTPEIVLLDYNLPDVTGVDLAALLRNRLGAAVGIVMVTARSMVADRIECRRVGADDYLVKPINFDELLALIDNLHRRLAPLPRLEVAWKLLPKSAELVPPGQPGIALTGWEVLLLSAIASAPQQQATREALVVVLGKNPQLYDARALETRMSRLRHKLPRLPGGRSPLEAVWGVGYQFIQPLEVAPDPAISGLYSP